MKTTLTLIVLSCVLFALAPALTNAEGQLRAEDDTTPTPLDAFKAAIAKFHTKPTTRRLLSDEVGKVNVKTFVKAMEELKQNGLARRMEEDDTGFHTDNLVGRVNGRNGFVPPTAD